MSAALAIEIDIGAAIVAVRGGQPVILVSDDALPALPSGPFDPRVHRTFEQALRQWSREQAGLQLGYVEQLYTFGDRGRHSLFGESGVGSEGGKGGGAHTVSVGYLALTRPEGESGAAWRSWYDLFPWEDWRGGRPPVMDRVLTRLCSWAGGIPARRARIALNFPGDEAAFDEERALDRYELLYEAGAVPEAQRDGRAGAGDTVPGAPMRHDHRRIAATAIARLRAKLRYRPVIFELVPESFTLTELQHAAEAIAGRTLHKGNFRRLIDRTGLVEPTGQQTPGTGGRPAALYRFRRAIVRERPATGIGPGRR